MSFMQVFMTDIPFFYTCTYAEILLVNKSHIVLIN